MSVSVIERVFLPALELRLVHLPYRNPSEHWDWGTFEFRLKEETLMSFPWEFLGDDIPSERRISWYGRGAPRLYVSSGNQKMGTKRGRWGNVTNVFEHLIYAYRDCPRVELLDPLHADLDPWGIVDILRAADRRLSFNRLTLHALMMEDGREAARRVLAERFKDRKSRY
jgi:hypothetical protein